MVFLKKYELKMKINNHTKLSIVVIVVAALLLETNTALEFFSTRDRFNEQLTEKAERDLAPLFERDDVDVVIDCAELKFISSSGLRLLLNIYKHVGKKMTTYINK